MTDKDKALVPVPQSLMERPDWLKGKTDNRGSENIRPEDLLLPRIKIAQTLSHELDEDHSAFIEGLKLGYFYNTLTRQNYGPEIEFTVIRAERPRGVEFFPLEDGGGVKDLNVPLDDPRMEFTTDEETGKVLKPIATIFYDYVVLLLPAKEPAQLSLKSSAINCAKNLNSLIRIRGTASFTGRYRLVTETKSGKVGKYAVPSVQNLGWVTQDEAAFAETLYGSIASKKLVVEVENDDDVVPEGVTKDVPF